MKNTDAVIDRIQRRREKLERSGVLTPPIASFERTALHLWQADENGTVYRRRDCPDPGVLGLDVVALPAGKFLPLNVGDLAREPFHLWNQHFAHLEDVPEQPPCIPKLLDAPEPPEDLVKPNVVITVDTSDATGDTQPSRPVEIDREAVLVDFAKHRAERDKAKADLADDQVVSQPAKGKPRTYEERYNRIQAELAEAFERQRLGQQKIPPRPASSMAMAPTIGTGWKGH